MVGWRSEDMDGGDSSVIWSTIASFAWWNWGEQNPDQDSQLQGRKLSEI
jgi:hypothetical protein